MDILSDSDEALRSDEESEPEQESEPEEESGKEKMLQSTWELVKKFKNKSEFTAFLKSEGCWSFRSSQKLASGIKTYWRCNLVKSIGCQCEAEIYSLHNYAPTVDESDDGNIEPNNCYMVYRRNAEHTHDETENLASKLSEETERKIIDFHIDGKNLNRSHTSSAKIRVYHYVCSQRKLK